MPRKKERRYRLSGLAVLAALGVMMSSLAAGAQETAEPSAEKGYQLAQRLCSNCHLIEDKANATLPAGVPTFRGIANRPGQTGQRITNTLMVPHAPMPDIRLSGPEIQDLISYLETLRTNPAIPPLLRKQQPKPKFPAPS